MIRIRLALCVVSVAALISAGCKDVVNPDVDLCPPRRMKVGKVTLNTAAFTLGVGDSTSVNAFVVNPQGNWDVCLLFPDYSSTDTTIATVRNDLIFLGTRGIVTGVRKGKAYIKATSGRVSDSVVVTVLAPN